MWYNKIVATINSDTRVTLGIVLAAASAIGSFMYSVANSATKDFVEDRIDKIKQEYTVENSRIYDELKYIRSRVDEINQTMKRR